MSNFLAKSNKVCPFSSAKWPKTATNCRLYQMLDILHLLHDTPSSYKNHIKGLEWNRTRTRETWRYTESNKGWSPAPVRMWAEKIWTDFSKNIHQYIGRTSLYFLSVKIAFLRLSNNPVRFVSVVMHKDLTGRQSTCSSIKVVFRIFRITILVICRSGMKGNLRNLGQMFQAIFVLHCASSCFVWNFCNVVCP